MKIGKIFEGIGFALFLIIATCQTQNTNAWMFLAILIIVSFILMCVGRVLSEVNFNEEDDWD